MQETLMVNGIECKTVAIDEKWNVVVDGEPQILYRVKTKNKTSLNGTRYTLKLKSICVICGKEFLGHICNFRTHCSRSCAGKVARKFTYNKFVSLSNDKELKLKAHRFINDMIRIGKIIRSKQCSACKTYCKPDAHHTDYIKLNEVIWLCVSCHKKLHFGHDIIGKLVVYGLN